jgi:astacin
VAETNGPPPLPFDVTDLAATEPGDDVKRGALRGNFDQFCRVVPYRTDGKLAVMDDDIIVGWAADIDGSDCVLRSGQAAPIDGQNFRWPYGVVPFEIDASVSQGVNEKIVSAIEYWNDLQLGLTWVRWSIVDLFIRSNGLAPGTAQDIVWFIGASAPNICSASVGRQEGAQVIKLGDQCALGSVIHEMAHTAGLWHEQQRPDRDRYIEIVWENIIPGHEHNFEQKHLIDLDDIPSPYDYDSITHYPADAFSVNGQPTIRTPNGEPIGQRTGLSQGDMEAIRAMYPYISACSCSDFSTCECRP